MKLQSIIGFTLAATSLVLAVSESSALARTPSTCRATASIPAVCTGRDSTGYLAGVGQGVSTVDQIWESETVNQMQDNWEILVDRVTNTIPNTVATVFSPTWSQYLQCRTQGLLEGSICRMNELNPIPGCQLDGVDWGKMSAALYCQLSVDLGGLADIPPWFIRTPPGMCGANFENYCEDTYRYGATRGEDHLDPAVEALLVNRSIDPASLLQPATCLEYTKSPWEAVFNDSIYVDCSYTIP